jgi:acyl-CoA synthetase (AMP-forming)/AMP-acid ligase II
VLSGVQKGSVVCCLCRNIVEGYALLVGCSKIGAIFAPLNFRSPPAELKQVLQNYQPVVVFYDAEYAPHVDEMRAALEDRILWKDIRLDAEFIADRSSPRSYRPKISTDDTCWICSTSGSTGRAKGVMLSQRNTLAGVINFIAETKMSDRDVYLRAGAIFHVGLFTPIAAWLTGARVVVTNFEARRALALLEEEGVTSLIAPGTILKLLVEEQERKARPLHLRLIIGGAAPLSASLAKRAVKAFGCEVAQIYGQTECTLMGTYLTTDDYCAGFAENADANAKIRLESGGRASPSCAVAILDDNWRRLPSREVGEVALSGANVMQGYWRESELTAATLKDGWLRTGDIGYVDENGYVFLLDRKKDMIISGAENVYSVQVETVIAAHPDVAEVAVIGIPDAHWGELVTAIIVPRADNVLHQQAVIDFCRGKLAGYKIPKRVEFRADLPRGSGGRKIDKAALKREFWGETNRMVHGI